MLESGTDWKKKIYFLCASLLPLSRVSHFARPPLAPPSPFAITSLTHTPCTPCPSLPLACCPLSPSPLSLSLSLATKIKMAKCHHHIHDPVNPIVVRYHNNRQSVTNRSCEINVIHPCASAIPGGIVIVKIQVCYFHYIPSLFPHE